MNNLAANNSESEMKASRRLFFVRDNMVKLGTALGRDISDDETFYVPGSSGWFGMFAINLLNVVGGRDASRDGFTGRWPLNPWAATVGYAAYVAALTRRSNWSQSSQDARAVKIGGAAGSLMSKPTHERSIKAVSNLTRAMGRHGIPSSFKTARPGIKGIYSGRNWLAVYREGKKRGY
jgi:hypothetical protein